MIKMDLEDFIFEVKEEILSYEEFGEKKANDWEQGLLKWLKDDKTKKINMKKAGDSYKYHLEDESEIFDIADEYISAVEENAENNYWKNLKL